MLVYVIKFTSFRLHTDPMFLEHLFRSGHRRLEEVFRTSEKGHDVLQPNQTSSRRLVEDV